MTYSSLTVMGGICCSPKGEKVFWRLPVGKSTAWRLLSNDNLTVDLTIKDLELAAYMAHLHISVPLMVPLEHTTKVDNAAAKSWASRGSVDSATSVGPLLIEDAWIYWQTQTHASVPRIAVVKNHDADAASRLKYLTVAEFARHFNETSPQQEPWRLCLLPCAAKHHMLTILHTKW